MQLTSGTDFLSTIVPTTRPVSITDGHSPLLQIVQFRFLVDEMGV
ncbi:MAG: hypothetical protein OXC14_10785 [Rhodospirillaceae bacterium]|nr:hypothetical protein [Rhodospirillaceae bacterium]